MRSDFSYRVFLRKGTVKSLFYRNRKKMEFYNGIFSSDWQFAALAFCALLIGFSKTGIQGAVVVSIPMMALAFGAKESTGVILPMLCFADLIAVAYYRRDADWRLVLKLLPSAVVGFFAALVADSFVSGRGFGILMASCIFIGLVTMFVARGERAQKIAKSGKCAVLFGILGGFTTMIGNAAGPVMSVYLLSAGLPKRSFVGTSAWFFLLVNYMKIPLQVLAWDNIGAQALKAGACGIPFIFIGAILGVRLVNIVPEKFFRALVVLSTIVGTIIMVI